MSKKKKKKKEWIEILRVLLAWGDSSMKKKNLEGTWALAPFREENIRRSCPSLKASLRVKIAHFTSLTIWEVRENRVAMS